MFFRFEMEAASPETSKPESAKRPERAETYIDPVRTSFKAQLCLAIRQHLTRSAEGPWQLQALGVKALRSGSSCAVNALPPDAPAGLQDGVQICSVNCFPKSTTSKSEGSPVCYTRWRVAAYKWSHCFGSVASNRLVEGTGVLHEGFRRAEVDGSVREPF